MTMALNYHPYDSSYCTTWWLPLRFSISNQTTTSSENNYAKSDNECFNIQRNIMKSELQFYCCIPFNISRKKAVDFLYLSLKLLS
ncbi:unnamed protein product [Rotaria socialis]|uniref:Uncharacterized protein n=1 Tax=Rotaria socialis TaxID=392032 RepID=A0A818CXE4_9BILA|nr:unnamed protein product [Rotaria socialis]